jgi:hypothetical protein
MDVVLALCCDVAEATDALPWEKGPEYRASKNMNGVSYLAFGIGLLTETAFALQQAPSPTLVAQVTGSAPSAGVLVSPPPAPVAVPPSGFLATVERRTVSTLPFKTAQKLQTANGPPPVRMRRHVAHARSPTRREATKRTPTTHQSVAGTPLIVKTTPEQQSHDGFELFFRQLGKGKE